VSGSFNDRDENPSVCVVHVRHHIVGVYRELEGLDDDLQVVLDLAR
jgi:hypothetical protein